MTEKTIKFHTPITTHYEGRYVQPGTEIELPASEAKSIIDRHGEWRGASAAFLQDPGNTNSTGVDAASIATLNEFDRINGGKGDAFKAIGETDEEEADDELEKMKKDDLIAYAELHKVEVKDSMTKDEIKAAIKAAGV